MRIPPTQGLALCIALVAAGAAPASAQDGGRALPTLESLGIGPWMNESGSIQFGVSGRADVDVYRTGDDPTFLMTETGTFVAPRVRLFGDLFLGEAWYVTTELRVDRGPMESESDFEFRVEQAFARWTPLSALALQLGRFASPFGSYPSRHHTDGDWFIRPPLMYEYRTVALSDEVPLDADMWVMWKDSAGMRARGAPPVWGAPYPWGAMAFGVLAGLDWRVAWMNSAPSSEPEMWGLNDFETDRGNLVAALGYRFVPWLRAQVSYSTGPFLQRELAAPLTGVHGPDWYVQDLIGAELLFQLAHTQVRVEALHDTWTILDDEDATDVSWYAEARQDLLTDWFVAARIGGIGFSDVATSTDPEPWDHDVQRIQVGAGYRFARNAEIRAEYLTQSTDGPVDPDDDVIAFQLWWAF